VLKFSLEFNLKSVWQAGDGGYVHAIHKSHSISRLNVTERFTDAMGG
jgi:hypothetical protein